MAKFQIFSEKFWNLATIFGQTFFGHNSAIFEPIGLKLFIGTQKTIIYRLVVRNPSYDVFFPVLIFGTLLAGKWAWPPRVRLIVWSLQTRTKIWPTRWTFWVNRDLEIMFSKFSGVNPPPPLSSNGHTSLHRCP